MLESAVLAALNHLLAAEPWATERLRGAAGKRCRVEVGPFGMDIAVDGDGKFRIADAGGEAAVHIQIPADALLSLPNGGAASLFAAARLTGSAELAETLAFVFRNLHWDLEGDLARVVGDIPARRLAKAGRSFASWQREFSERFSANLVDFASEEGNLVVPRREFDVFRAALATLRDDLARLEKRLA